MQYRKLDKSGKDVSVLGMGCMRLPLEDPGNPESIDYEKTKELILKCFEKGINYYDTAFPYHKGKSEEVTGRIINELGIRDKVFLTTKMPVWLIKEEKDFDTYLELQLKKLGTDRIDFYLLHALKKSYWDNLVSLDVFKFLERAKKEGKINQIGFSFHDGYPIFEKIINAYDWDVCQIQFNYLDTDYQAGLKGYRLAREKNIPVISMEPLRGGSLVNGLTDEAKNLFSDRSPAYYALRWVWDFPGIKLLLSGMNSPEQIEENCAIAEQAFPGTLSEKERGKIEQAVRSIEAKQKVKCTSCNYCIDCPKGIPISSLFSFYNAINMLNSKPDMYINAYKSFIENKVSADQCIECGECESKCPQEIPVIKKLKEVHQFFIDLI